MSQSALSFDDGGNALVRDPRQVPVRLRRGYERAKLALGVLGADIPDLIESDDPKAVEAARAAHQRALVLACATHPELVDAVTDTLILALVSEWSYGPVSQSTLDDLPSGSYDALKTAAEKLAPQMSPNFEVSPDPKATIEPSNG